MRDLGSNLKSILLAGSLLAALAVALPAAADDRRPGPDPLYDIVAVGRGAGKIVLATLARPASALRWRFRSIPLQADATAQAVVLSRSGTKLLVVLPGGAERVLDLTTKLTGIDAGLTPASLHRLPGQFFPARRGDRICVLDDAGQTAAPGCKVAAKAAMHEDGRVLYATADGSLWIARAGTETDQPLPYRLPPGARYELLPGQRGDQRDFLLLVAHAGAVEIVDPTRAAGSLHSYANWEMAALRALLEFSSAGPCAGNEPPSDQVLSTLAANLLSQTQPETFEWAFFRVRPEKALYAPVLEFAPDEPAYPSDVAIWNTLNPISNAKTREAYQEAYDSLGKQRWARCAVYFRHTSYPGSWLLEYWFYYPFDEGKPHRHIHDSEHVFVEVDKLGGAVRAVLASDHGQFAPNNGYSTFVSGARPIELPLFALVEFEKHAMCPDINHDGVFTSAVDVNLYPDKRTVWGLRDLGANKEHLMMRYTPAMSLPRYNEDRFALAGYAGHFPELEVNPEKASCALLPFPNHPPRAPTQDPGTVESAVTHLTAHTDARKPEDIYKPWVLPYRQVRVGWGLFDHVGNQAQLYFAYVSELAHLAGGLLPLPGRLSLEAMWSPVTRHFTFPANAQTVFARRYSITYLGARYERLLTGTQGFYFGVTPLLWRAENESVNGSPVPADPRWEYKGVWYRAGYIFELPFQKKGNMTHHVGYLLQGKSVRFEWRVSLGLLRRRGRHWFGISESDPNPYQ